MSPSKNKNSNLTKKKRRKGVTNKVCGLNLLQGKNIFFPWEKKEGAIFLIFFLNFFLNFYGWSALEEGSFEVSKDLKVAKFGGYRWVGRFVHGLKHTIIFVSF